MPSFEEVILKYEKLIYNLARRLMGDVEDAKDITQEVAIKIYKNLASCKGEEFLKAWISKITHNACMDALRRRKGKHFQSLDEIMEFDGGQLEASISQEGESPEGLLLRKELGGQIEAALAALPHAYREVVILRDVLGHTYEEMAEILNLPEGTIKSRLFRGRNQLKTILLREQNLSGQRQSL